MKPKTILVDSFLLFEIFLSIRCSLRSRLVDRTIFFFPPNKEFGKPHVFVFAPQNFFLGWGRLTACIAGHAIQRKNPHDEPQRFSKWRLPTLPQRSAVPSAMLSLCPVLSLLPAPLSAPLSPAPAHRRRAQPTPRMAHTAPHSATPPPMRHTYHPQNLPIPPDYIKDMVSLNKECAHARTCILYKVYRSFQ